MVPQKEMLYWLHIGYTIYKRINSLLVSEALANVSLALGTGG
jgi:hypothetical protein